MSFSPIPDYKFRSITDISTGFLKKHGITLLMLDLDNTIAPYSDKSPDEHVPVWARRIKSAGIKLHIVSNSNRPARVSSFADALRIPYIYNAGKPSPRAIRELLANLQIRPENAALAGDQIYTDVLAANGAGVMSVVVHPIKLKNPFLALRYMFELPFRATWRTK